jgi:hypothetical protein
VAALDAAGFGLGLALALIERAAARRTSVTAPVPLRPAP